MIVRTDTVEGQAPSCNITETIAETADVEIHELPPLYETIDPEALDAFLRCPDGTDAPAERSVEFSYCGYRVRVDSTGRIQLSPEPALTSSVPSA